MNDTMKAIHGMLCAQHNALAKKLEDETDPAKAQAILTEMQEILHRINLIQRLLFIESSKNLDNMLDKITDASAALTEEIRKIGKVVDFVKGVSQFLSYVDKAIDLAKTVASKGASTGIG